MSQHRLLLVLALLPAAACADPPRGFDRVVTGTSADGALLSAWFGPTGVAYYAGGALGSGPGGARLVRWDGHAATRIDTGDATPFWWIHGFPDGTAWLAGEGGQVHLMAADGTVSRVEAGAPAESVLYGVWGATPDDLWIVGGPCPTCTAPESQRIIRRRNAMGQWFKVDSPAEVPAGLVRSYYKVWGPSADDVWIVGEGGVVLRALGGPPVKVDAPAGEVLFTVHGCSSNDVWAVGGVTQGTLIHWDGVAWTRKELPGDVNGLNGVSCLAPGQPRVAGQYGYAAQWRGDRLLAIETPKEIKSLTIHGLFTSPGSRVIGAGGSLESGTYGFGLELR